MSERPAPWNPNTCGILGMDNARVRRPLTKVVRSIKLPIIETFDANNAWQCPITGKQVEAP